MASVQCRFLPVSLKTQCDTQRGTRAGPHGSFGVADRVIGQMVQVAELTEVAEKINEERLELTDARSINCLKETTRIKIIWK